MITVLDSKNLWNIMWSMIVLIPSTLYPSFDLIASCISAWMFFNLGYYSWRKYVNSIGENIRSSGPIVQWVDENNLYISAITHRRVTSKNRKVNNLLNVGFLAIIVAVLSLSTNALTTTAVMITATYQSIIDTLKIAHEQIGKKKLGNS